MNGILVDSSVLVSLLKKELGEETKSILRERKAAISIISFVETCRFFHLAGKAREWNALRAEFSDFEILPLTKDVGEMAARNSVEKKLALADSIIYATAQFHGLTLVTKDKEFKGLKNVLIIK